MKERETNGIHRCIVITSAAYLEPQLEAEFGRIPPAFLPLGNKRLYEHHHQLVTGHADRMLLSVPESYSITRRDSMRLTELGFEIVPVPDRLSLGESILYVVNIAGCADDSIAILHGDTLFDNLDLTLTDTVSVAPSSEGYQWQTIKRGKDLELLDGDSGAELTDMQESLVLSGWFSFSNSQALVQEVTRARGNFIQGLFAYSRERQLKAIDTGTWYDFGHADTYYQSRRKVTTQRCFNELSISRRAVRKSSSKSEKIKAEASWFTELPAKVRVHTPAFLGYEDSPDGPSYELEYLHLPTLADLWVFGRLPVSTWSEIFAAAGEALEVMSAFRPSSVNVCGSDSLYSDKTRKRLEEYARTTGFDLTSPCRYAGRWLPSVNEIVNLVSESIAPATEQYLSLIHGDFCFSNLLYDRRASLIRMIDPRGVDAAGAISQYGDRRYDLGKLYHSVIGQYDHVIAGHYRLSMHGGMSFSLDLPEEEALLEIQREFLSHSFVGLTPVQSSAHSIAILLFLSMLPLHADNPERQQAFLANALRLFLKWEKKD